MTLKRLQMQGFKSFAKRAVFEFAAPVTAIVGPNGSGKSNVVEAIRFVLGEQSSKSLRSKSGSDLIFKGSKQLGKLSRADVAITFDNKKRIFNLPDLNLDFDEITISREIFSDGTSVYALNNNEVRLKDIHELIASVNIGSSGHHIISQGEADRLLNAKSVERREMLEESLGLKLYHYRIRESERKLEKTRTHLHEVELLRRELAPHIKFLKKQVEKIEKAQEIEEALKSAYHDYLVKEQTVIARAEESLKHEETNNKKSLEVIEQTLRSVQTNSSEEALKKIQIKISEVREQIAKYVKNKEDLGRQIGRVEGMIDAAHRSPTQIAGSAMIAVSDIEIFVTEIEEDVQVALDSESGSYMRNTLSQIAIKLRNFIEKRQSKTTQTVAVDVTELEATKQNLEDEMRELDALILKQEQEIKSYELEIAEARNRSRDQDRAFYEAQSQKNTFIAQQNQLMSRIHELQARSQRLQEEYLQAERLIGSGVVELKRKFYEGTIHEEQLHTQYHEIERMKIRLEDMGGGSGGDIMKEYDETVTRDQFLEKEITDLETATKTLTETIESLKEQLTSEFKLGIIKINKEFEEFFKLMFGGGTAKLSLVNLVKKEDDQEVLSDDRQVKEEGIDIDVSLPRKKVKDLEMLSGGERSLTSIALLFALSQVNPPPFLVLDETDAALDEANSQKYGDMIENLAKQTQLIVVTHNRETMSRADILYGVTLGSDDASKLLSIKFEEAVKVAK